jgi:hypothetical protein
MTRIFSKPITAKPAGKWMFGNCYYNATYNKYHAFKKVKGLKVVYGSLGLNGHFEYGGKNWGQWEFFRNPFDSHAWLEDEDGNVYDYIYEGYGFCAKHWGKEITFPLEWEIVGISKAELLEMGLDYVPAPKPIQRDILTQVRQMYAQKFKMGVLPAIKFDNIPA